MSGYVEPEYSRDQLVDADDCFARAQRALEVTEFNLERAVTSTGGVMSVADAMAHASARAAIGRGWAELGAALDRQRRQR